MIICLTLDNPHCGDSKKSKLKARAYLYRVKNDMFFKCHNWHNQNLANFIKYVDPKMYSEYLLERYKKSAPTTPKPKFDFKPAFEDRTILDDLKSIKQLDDKHPDQTICNRIERYLVNFTTNFFLMISLIS